MSIEDDVREALVSRSARVIGTPDTAWERFGSRPSRPSPGGRLIAATVACVVFAAASVLLWRALTPARTPTVRVPVPYASASDLAGKLHEGGLGCDRLGVVHGILQPGVDVRSCQVNGVEVWLWVYQTREAINGFRSQPEPGSWNGIWNVRGPNWVVATTDGQAAQDVHEVIGGQILGGTGSLPSISIQP